MGVTRLIGRLPLFLLHTSSLLRASSLPIRTFHASYPSSTLSHPPVPFSHLEQHLGTCLRGACDSRDLVCAPGQPHMHLCPACAPQQLSGLLPTQALGLVAVDGDHLNTAAGDMQLSGHLTLCSCSTHNLGWQAPPSCLHAHRWCYLQWFHVSPGSGYPTQIPKNNLCAAWSPVCLHASPLLSPRPQAESLPCPQALP